MKLKSLLLLATSALSLGASAQTTVQIGNGTAAIPLGPIGGNGSYNTHAHRAIHYSQQELAANGIHPGTHINAIKWFKANNAAYTEPDGARAILYIRNVSPAYTGQIYGTSFVGIYTFLSNTFTPVDTIYLGTLNNAPDNDWMGFEGFDYTFAGEELEVYVDYKVISSNSMTAAMTWMTHTTPGEYHMMHRDGSINSGSVFQTSTNRPNTQFTYSDSPAPLCPQIVESGTPQAIQGTVQASDPVWVNLTGNYTDVDGLTTFQWQSAEDPQGVWSNISPLLDGPYFEFNAPNTTMVYRCIVVCGSNSDTSNFFGIAVDPAPPACPQTVVAGTAFSNADILLCPGTNFELDITGNTYVPGSTTFTWESAPSANGPWSVYSNPLPQPIIGLGAPYFTTWYRAKVACGGNEAYTDAIEVSVVVGPSGHFTINDALPTGNGNFHSFSSAVLSLGCGISGDVVFDVAPGSGPYDEQVVIGQIATSPTATVTFNCNGVTLEHVSDDDNKISVVMLNGADYITFKNLKVTMQGVLDHNFACGFQLMNDADNNTIDSCEVTLIEAEPSAGKTNYAGIAINGDAQAIEDGTNSYCDNNRILNNTVKNGYYGIVFWGPGDGDMMSGNIAKGNTVQDFYSKGIMCLNSDNSRVERNNISRPTRAVSGAFFGVEIAGCSNTTVDANRIHDPVAAEPNTEYDAAAINVINCNPANAAKNYVINNLVYEFNTSGGTIGVQLENCKNLNIYHNTISLDNQHVSCLGCPGVYGIYQHYVQSSKLDIKNNLITMNGTGGGESHMLHFEHLPLSTQLYNNNYYFAPGITNAAVGFMDGDDYETLTEWQQAVFGEQNSLTLNPMYEDAANGNFKPTKDSLDNKGIYVDAGNDITNALRYPTATDIGAYEFEVVVTSVNNARKAAEVAIYPNPATDYINIVSPEKIDVQIMSIDGRTVSRQSNATKVNVSSLAEGNYILKILNKEGAVIKADKIFKVNK